MRTYFYFLFNVKREHVRWSASASYPKSFQVFIHATYSFVLHMFVIQLCCLSNLDNATESSSISEPEQQITRF